MQPTDPKVFAVTIIHCKDASHAEKIATALRRSFPHRRFKVDSSQHEPGFSTMVLADSCKVIRASVSDLLEGAKCVCGEQFFFGASGEASSVPPSYMRFDAPLPGDAKV